MKTFSSILLLIFLFLITGCTGTVPTNNAPMINSIPLTNSLVGALYTYNVEAADTDGDTLTYSLTSGPPGMTIDSSTGVISWTPNATGDYNVTLKVSDGVLFDTQSFTITILLTEITTLSPPANVSASDTIVNKVQITWDAVSGASYYQVYRADALLGSKTAVSGWQTGTSYDDTSITAGTTYYYWVKAATSSSGDNASDYSNSDTGSSIVFSIYPSPPTGVSASDGLVNKVQIVWDAVSGASHYQVYRASFSSGLGRTAISGWQTGTSYDDNSVTAGITYYYWVKAATSSSGDNASDYSEYNSGFSTIMIPINLDPPTNVKASDGTYTDKVRITWNTVTGASYYKVYRSSFPFTAKIGISFWQTGASYDDKSVDKGITYYYWVKAATSSSGDNASDYSASNSGYAAFFIFP
jgi:fibronectin type 3 domain-containing protein